MHDEKLAFVGIDPGMRYLKMALFNPATRKVEIFRDESDFPAVLYYPPDEGGVPLVGKAAERALDDDRKRKSVVQNLKTLLAKPSEKVVLGDGRAIDIVDVLAEIFSYLKSLAERRVARNITHCVVTYPDVAEVFNELARERLVEAARRADFEDVHLLTEPEAASLALRNELSQPLAKKLVICDVGHSTTDLAYMSANGDGADYETLRTCSLSLGGMAFDTALYKHFDKLCRATFDRSISGHAHRMDASFMRECRRLREALTDQDDFQIKMELGTSDGSAELHRFELTREEHNRVTAEVASRLANYVAEFIAEVRGQFGLEEWDLVLVGGASRMPNIQSQLAVECKREPVLWLDRDYAVAIGAAYHANSLWGVRDRFRRAVRKLYEARIHTKLTHDDVKKLHQLGGDLALTQEEIEADEVRECNGRTLSMHLAEQDRGDLEAYGNLIQAIHSGTRVEEEQVRDARAFLASHKLAEDVARDIERKIMGTALAERRASTIREDESRRGPTVESERLYQEAQKMMSGGNLSSARSKIDAAVSLALATGSTEWADPHYLKAEINRKLGEWEAGENAASACLKYAFNNALAYRCRGICRMERRLADLAFQDLTTSIALSSTGAAFAYRAILQATKHGAYKDAITDLQSAARQASSCEEHGIPKVALLAVVAYIRHQKLRESEASLRDYALAISELPSNVTSTYRDQFTGYCQRFGFEINSTPVIALQQKLLAACQAHHRKNYNECTRELMIDFRKHNSKAISSDVWGGVGGDFPFYMSMLAAEDHDSEHTLHWLEWTLKTDPRFDICRATRDQDIRRQACEHPPLRDLLTMKWGWGSNWLTEKVWVTNNSRFDFTSVAITMTISKTEGYSDAVRERSCDRIRAGETMTWNAHFGTVGFAGRLIARRHLLLSVDQYWEC